MTTPISEKTKRILHELGLTEYEARAYLSLIEKGAVTANQLSEYANVPYSKIYETLNSLDRKGWIETEEGRPKRYYPRSPSEALGAAKLRLENMTKSWEQAFLSELQPLYERREIREKPDIWILRGEFNMLAKLREVLDKAKSELMIAAPMLTKTLVESIVPTLMRLPRTGVRVLFMVSRDVKEGDIGKIANVAEVRVRDHMFGGGVIVDDEEVVLLLGEEKPTLVLWSDHMGLVRFAKDYFQYLWNSSEGL
ncbi:MAG: Sugar-specific transcriptional regulator TrmB [Candidatus Bathyarchaeota archaeon BA1]|nr:MAG: Sugar-specific transcriptional regulator TrmB [Candidatus Bathyarchaeota archaeon BA1]